MRKEILTTGKDVEIAVQNAIEALGASALEDISYEIVDLGSRGIFGIGARPTKVRAWIDMPDTVAPPQHGTVTPAPRKEREATEGEKAPAQGQKKNNAINNQGTPHLRVKQRIKSVRHITTLKPLPSPLT